MARREPVPMKALPAGSWSARVPIRFSHCDPAGIVYYARYFDLLNGAVEDWFAEALGLDYHDFIGPRRVGLGYAHAEADFLAPARMGDILRIALLVVRVGGASLALEAHAYKDGAPAFAASLVIVTTSLVEHRAIPLPEDLRSAAESYQERCR